MGTIPVDQIDSGGSLRSAPDARLSEREKNALLLAALPGAKVEEFAGERVVRFRDQVIAKKQVTHLGRPWEAFKKRIQIPKRWLEVHRQAARDGLESRFVGIYHFADVTIFVDFEPDTYVLRKANNSAAHVATNDLFQAQTLGSFSRVDQRGNRLTSVRSDEFSAYLLGTLEASHPRIETFERFNREILSGRRLEWREAVEEMHADVWPDRFQGEWPGFYLEYRLDRFLRENDPPGAVTFQKSKTSGSYDYDLMFPGPGRAAEVEYYGDLKASSAAVSESLGNDAADLDRCLNEFGRFWYVIYEHETWLAKDAGDAATIEWNEWRRGVGFTNRKEFDPLSYRSRFKAAVRYTRMDILEVNEANAHIVLAEFRQGRQQSGAARAPKVKINKKAIENFLIYSASWDRVD